MARNYAALPHEYLEEMTALDDAEFGGLIRALLQYSATGERPEVTGNARFYAHRVFMQEDRFQEHYDELAAVRSETGRKAAARRWADRDASSISSNAQNANTKTKTKTETKTKLSSQAPRSTDRRSASAAAAAQAERMRQDMAEVAQVIRGCQNDE